MIQRLLEEISEKGAALVAVSKTKTPGEILQVYRHGVRDFGENKVQELLEKHDKLPEDVRWHMVGHLQSNKVKYLAPFIHLIHSVDSKKLLLEVEKQAEKFQRIIDVLLQVKISIEPTKYGLDQAEIDQFLADPDLDSLEHVQIRGLMGMASFVEDQRQIRKEFRNLKTCFDRLKDTYFSNNNSFDTLSMGMSGDYQLALEEGSTMVRIGTLVFGART